MGKLSCQPDGRYSSGAQHIVWKFDLVGGAGASYYLSLLVRCDDTKLSLYRDISILLKDWSWPHIRQE